jgi:DNA (cytosine-5)-methyltransferase 1
MRPLLLDLFCGAGGAAMGYHRAGFDVIGVDINPQPHYPFEFMCADVLDGLEGWGDLASAIHASPPCQAYSRLDRVNRKKNYPDLIAPTRELLKLTRLPWVIENVPEAPLNDPVTLCGSMFELDVRRHRAFETSWGLSPHHWPCRHQMWAPRFRSLDARAKTLATVVGVHGHLNYPGEFALRQAAMGIDWMTNAELTQAIPPAYTEYIGQQLMLTLSNKGSPSP